jgi:uncharacterized protein YbjT (DUF2867 family)
MILVIGATGNIGGALVRELEQKKTAYRALVRDKKKAEASGIPAANLIEGDLAKPETLERALAGVEKVFVVTPAGPEQQAQETNLIKRAKAAGVKHLVKMSALGADEKSDLTLARSHGTIERELKSSGLTWTILQPHFFMQNFLHYGTIASDAAFYAPLGDAKVAMIDARDIASTAAAVLTTAGHENRTYVLTGGEALSFAEAAKELSKQLGREVRYIDVTPEQAKQGIVASGAPEWLADDLVKLYGVFKAGHGAFVSTAVQQVTGRAPRKFADFVRDNAVAFKR